MYVDEIARQLLNKLIREPGIYNEQLYIKHHKSKSKGAWNELFKYYSDNEQWGKTICRFQNSGNRRRVILETSPYNTSDLKKVAGWLGGSIRSAITTLGNENTEKKQKYLAEFGTIMRVPYETTNDEFPLLLWSDTNYRILKDRFITEIELLTFINNDNRDWLVIGKTLRINGVLDLFLRIERRESGLVLIDLNNPELFFVKYLTELLKETGMQWSYFTYPTIDPNHNIMIFINTHTNAILDEIIESEFIWITKNKKRKL